MSSLREELTPADKLRAIAANINDMCDELLSRCAECADGGHMDAHAETAISTTTEGFVSCAHAILALPSLSAEPEPRVQAWEKLREWLAGLDYRPFGSDVIAKMTRLVPLPAEGGEKPPERQMLLLAKYDTEWHWYCRDHKVWTRPLGEIRAEFSSDFEAVDRQRSDPAALALYDSDMHQEAGNGE